MIYVEIFPNKKLPYFIEGYTNAVFFYEVVTKYFGSNNLKIAVTKHVKYELVLQSTLLY